MRALVQQWKEAGPILEEIRIQEERAISEREAARIANEVLPEVDYRHVGKTVEESAGFMEQQRLFTLARNQ